MVSVPIGESNQINPRRYSDRFRLEDVKSLVESLQNEIVKVLPRNNWIVLNLEWVRVRQSNKNLYEGISY
jgi:collagenase-like PrtC family protease